MERQKVTTPYGDGEINEKLEDSSTPKKIRVNTPFGQGEFKEELEESIHVKLDTPHVYGNREYILWVFNKSEVKYD